jgi:dynein heavy chain
VCTANEEFDPEKVGSISLAAKFLCLWVIAMEKYGKIYRYLLHCTLNVFLSMFQDKIEENDKDLKTCQLF